MTALQTWIEAPTAAALGWAVFHSLWEGAVIALLLSIALCVLRTPRLRYAAGCVAMLVMLAAFSVTLWRELPHHGRVFAPRTASLPFPPRPDPSDSGAVLFAPRTLADFIPWAATFWIAGVVLFQIRNLAAWSASRRIRGSAVCAAPVRWQAVVDDLAAHLDVRRRVVLLESCLAAVPVVAGHFKPIVLIPLGMLAGMPAEQVESILIHELAHIARRDYLVNLLQNAVEGLLFYHPAVWWISKLIRAERENCCDDMVLAANGDAYQYAAALTALEENRWPAHEPALAATGGNLVKRIRRLLKQPDGPRVGVTPVFSAALLAFAMAAVLTAWQAQPAASAPAAATASPQQSSSALTTPYRKWLTEDVAYIITDQERAEYKALRTDEDREQFIEQFWKRRDPTPDTEANEFKIEHYRRIAYTNEHFANNIVPGWKTDRGRIYITFGPPDEIDDHSAGGTYTRPVQDGGATVTTVPFQQWRYRYIEGVGTNILIEFIDPNRNGEFRMTSDPSEKTALLNMPPNSGPAAPQRIRTGPLSHGVPIPPQVDVFTSTGDGPPVTVSVAPDRKMYVSVELENGSGFYDIVGQTMDAQHRLVASFRDRANACQGEGCTQKASVNSWQMLVPAGTYTFTSTIKDQNGAVHTRTVNFYVN